MCIAKFRMMLLHRKEARSERSETWKTKEVRRHRLVIEKGVLLENPSIAAVSIAPSDKGNRKEHNQNTEIQNAKRGTNKQTDELLRIPQNLLPQVWIKLWSHVEKIQQLLVEQNDSQFVIPCGVPFEFACFCRKAYVKESSPVMQISRDTLHATAGSSRKSNSTRQWHYRAESFKKRVFTLWKSTFHCK